MHRKATTLISAAAAVGAIGLLPATVAAGGSSCFGQPATIVGTSGDDTIQGTASRDVIALGGGDDTADARGGADLVCGGNGEDLIDLGPGADRGRGDNADDGISGGAGRDLLQGNDGFDFLFGEGGSDVSKGHAGGDGLIDGAGHDRLAAGPGMDFLHGGAGDDGLLGGTGNLDLASYNTSPVGVTVDLAISGPQPTRQGMDRLTGLEGLEGSRHQDQLFGDDLATRFGNGLFGLRDVDAIDGRGGVDFIDGATGADSLIGGPGDDAGFEESGLLGGPGPDQLSGGAGDDNLFGQDGDDTLLGGEAAENGPGDFGSGGAGTDDCAELETDDGTCETLVPRAADTSVDGSGRWSTVRRKWAGLTER